MSGHRIYSSGDDLGFLNGTAFLLLLLSQLFFFFFPQEQSFSGALFQPLVVRVGMTPPLASETDLKCKASTLVSHVLSGL